MKLVKTTVSLLLSVLVIAGLSGSALAANGDNLNDINMEVFKDLQSSINSAIYPNQGHILKITEVRCAPKEGYTAACDLIVRYKNELTFRVGENGEASGTLRETTELVNPDETKVSDPKKVFDFETVNRTTKLNNQDDVTTAQWQVYGDYLTMCYAHYYEDVWRVDIDENTYMVAGYYRQDLLGEMTHFGAPIETKHQVSVFKRKTGELLKITLKRINGRRSSMDTWTFL